MPITSRQQTAIALGCALSVTLLGSGCSSLSNALSGDKIDYRSSGSQSVRLDVPPDLSQLAGQSRFTQVTPAIVTASSMGQQTPGAASTGNQVAPKAVGDIRLERQGQTRWLVVNQSPEQVYEKVRAFWSSVGFELVIDQPAAGLMETNWNENRAKLSEGGVRGLLGSVLDRLYDTGERDQFRTRLERTAQGTEVYVTHRGLEEVFEGDRKERTTWRGRPSDANLEAEMLARMMVALGGTKEQADQARDEATKQQPTAQPASGTLAVLNADATSLTLRSEPDLAWRRVGLALDRGGFTVEGRDRASSSYEVRLSVNDPAAAQPGFFSRLFGRGNKEETLARYRVKLQTQGRETLVSVLSEAGQPVNNDTTRLIAKRLVDELN
ncbi:outer membrane protein assembly factor BamC [Aquabacterium parvum]|uniref:outer membrane protein assembly factor BamC n=2 Tax=Aquabacterium TaxID=92793 RepID=UPI00128E9826|nr:outer membrane protein assembly factor BamC [Aquabacterium parvum]